MLSRTFNRYALLTFAGMGLAKAASAAVITSPDLGSGSTHIFEFTYSGSGTESGSFTVPSGVSSVSVLVVAGGGGGGSGYSGGGGAGGLIYNSLFAVTPGPVSLTVGAGAHRIKAILARVMRRQDCRVTIRHSPA